MDADHAPRGPAAEDAFIARHFARFAGAGAYGLKDDAARIAAPPGHDLVVTVDTLVAGVHFFADDPPSTIGAKALRVNLSDLVAKGAQPLGYLLALSLPAETPEAWMAAFASGLGEDGLRLGCALLGGDTVRTPGPLTLSITAFGVVPAGRMPTRLDARDGDAILVSGTIGDAALGLIQRLDPDRAASWGLTASETAVLQDRFEMPQPRIGLIEIVRGFAHAAMDVSDGLIGDLARICRASRLGAEIEVDAVPLSAAARKAVRTEEAAMETVLTGGDDYEILMTVAQDEAVDALAAAAAAGERLTRIGIVTAGPEGEVHALRSGVRLDLSRQGYSHV